MRSLREIIIENNKEAIAEVKELVGKGKSENYIVNYCRFKNDLPEEIVRAFVRNLKEGGK